VDAATAFRLVAVRRGGGFFAALARRGVVAVFVTRARVGALAGVRAADVLRAAGRFALAPARFCCLPLGVPVFRAVADRPERPLADVVDLEERGFERPLADVFRVDPLLPAPVRARAAERGALRLAMTRPFLSNLDSFPISNVCSIAYRD